MEQRHKPTLKFRIILALAKLSGLVVRLVRPDGGTAFPGNLALRLDRHFYENFRHIPPERIIFISGSNGKSTVTSLIRHELERNGLKAAYSKKGTNLLPGITTIFIQNVNMRGEPTADYYLVEADERTLPVTSAAYTGKYMVLTNIMQDQIHRNGDPDYIYRIVRGIIRKDMTLYLNAHEPRSMSLAPLGGEAKYYSVAEHSAAKHRAQPLDVTLPCPLCGDRIAFKFENSARMGEFRCEGCGYSTPENSVELTDVDFEKGTFKAFGEEFRIPYPTPVFLYDYAAALALLRDLGLTPKQLSTGLDGFVNIAGRVEKLEWDGMEINYLRMKQENPETLQGALDAIAQDKREKVFVIGLCTLDERRPQWVPHYANTYYAFDCDFKELLDSNVAHTICFSKYVCSDIANRLIYDGADPKQLTVIDSDGPQEVMDVVERTGCKVVYMITLLRVYEGFRAYIKEKGGRSL